MIAKEAWETQEEKNIQDEADRCRYWHSMISQSKKESEVWRNKCRSAWSEYQAESSHSANEYQKLIRFGSRAYPRYWSDTMTILPAIFSNLPTITAQPECEKDATARTAAIILEKLGSYIMRRCDAAKSFTTTCLDFLHCSRATARIYFSADIRKRKKRVELQQQETVDEATGEPFSYFVDPSGEEYPGDVLYDAEGLPYFEEDDTEEEVADPNVFFRPLFFDQVLISPGARLPSDIWWQAYECTTTRKEAAELFGDIVAKIKSNPDDPHAEGIQVERKDLFQYWEIWDKRDKKVYRIHELLPDQFLKPRNPELSEIEEPGEGKEEIEPYDPFGDPYGLVGFFPSPPMMMVNERYNSLYPTTDYEQTRELYSNLSDTMENIYRISKSIKGVALFDSSCTEVGQMFNELFSGEAIGVQNFRDLLEKGGLDSLVMWPNYSSLAQTLQLQLQSFSSFKAELDEIRGISDIIRGQSDPITTYGAEKLKKQMSTNRLSLRQKEFARFVRDILEMQCDIALSTFEDSQIKDAVNFQYLDDEDKERFPQALAMLRDPKDRKVRVEIESDSLTAIDEEEDKQGAMELITAMSTFLANIAALVKEQPYFAPLAVKIAEISLGKMKFGKHAQDELNQAFQGLYEIINQPPPQPMQPPPDPRVMKIQSDEKIAQVEIQMQAQATTMKQQLDQFNAQIEAARLELDKQKQYFDQQIAQQKLGFEAQYAQMDMQEKLIEERRLAQQHVEIPAAEMRQKATQAPAEAPAPVTININPEQSPPMIPQYPDFGGIIG